MAKDSKLTAAMLELTSDYAGRLEDERDALVAKVALLVSLIKEAAEADESKDFLGHAWHDKYYDECTAAQCLAEIKAEAGRDGFVAGFYKAKKVYSCELGQCATALNEFADEYSAKIRNAGTWLRDENVNGGKRQGGV